MRFDYEKIGLVLHIYFDYALVVALFWYGYALIFDRGVFLDSTAKDCKIFAFCCLAIVIQYFIFTRLFILD